MDEVIVEDFNPDHIPSISRDTVRTRISINSNRSITSIPTGLGVNLGGSANVGTSLQTVGTCSGTNNGPTTTSEGGGGVASSNHVSYNDNVIDLNSPPERVVAVRYFLDRPGYGLHNSALRLWFDPPECCRPHDVLAFLVGQGIALEFLLIEVYLDKFQSFMLLEACSAACIEWDFTDSSLDAPGVLNIRLTDTEYAGKLDQMEVSGSAVGVTPGVQSRSTPVPTAPAPRPSPSSSAPPELANTTPIAVFAFAFMNGLEAAQQMEILIPGTLSPSFASTRGPYMIGMGLLQIIAACFQVPRGNIYGAVAFLAFGGIWFSNGLAEILATFFSGSEPANALSTESDYWGDCIETLYFFAFSIALLIQTFKISKVSTTLITLLCIKLLFAAFAHWSAAVRWIYFIFAWLTSFTAFYAFLADLTNNIYHKEVMPLFKWSEEDSPDEIFGAPGRPMTLYSKAARLRQARFPVVPRVRAAMVEHKKKNV